MEEFKTNPAELLRFHQLLTKDRKGYAPYYFPLQREGKDPWERVSWKANRKTLKEALYLMQRGYNIGIAAKADDPLVIVDIDDMEQVPDIKPTLQTISRKRIGRHNYFFAKDETAKRNIAADTAGEVRAVWQYVVVPGSYVPCSDKEYARMPEEEKVNAGHYTVFKELPVSEITYNEFPEVYKKALNERAAINKIAELKKECANKNVVTKTRYSSALWDLTVYNVSGVYETGGKRVPMPSEIHGSETGKNCSVSQGLLHCWRHNVAHNAFSYLAVAAGVTSCEQAGLEHGAKFYGVDAKDGETVFEVWKYAKERGIIPSNDPIPKSALCYYAMKRKVIKECDEENNLSEVAYRLTLDLLEDEGINHGRN